MKLIERHPDKGYIDEFLWVPKSHINVEGTKAALTFNVMDARKMRFLALYDETENHLLLPREFWDPTALPFDVVDARPTERRQARVKSNIVLDAKTPNETTQKDAVRALQESRGGILQLACGKGKTVCALELIAREKVPALIVVDNTQLLTQWAKAIEQFLIVPDGVGLIQGDEFNWKKDVVLATYQTLAARAANFTEEARRWFGIVVWDEAHHMAAPTWMRTATLFPCKRIGLTATPTRSDGMHVIYDFHIGQVLYKDLIQELKPLIYFYWTGLDVDISDSAVRERVCDVNGALHTSMLSSYFGQWRPRLELILNEVKQAAAQGRKILVLSYSIDELVNMLALWNGEQDLYTDLPIPTAQDVGEEVPPVHMDDKTYARVAAKLNALKRGGGLSVNEQRALTLQIKDLEFRLKQREVAGKVRLELEKRQRTFVKKLLGQRSTAGLMIGDIKPKERQRMLQEKQVTFAIMKYGREGLDEQSLDTVFVCEPMSQKNSLQQLMGRVLRKKDGKKTPIVVFFEDNIGPMVGMCTNLRRHLRSWPLEEGGPFAYEMVGHPHKNARHMRWQST